VQEEAMTHDVDKAVDYLVDTDAEFARATAYASFSEDKKKTVLATLMAGQPGSISARKMNAEASPEYLKACEDARDAIMDREILRNRRKSAELVVEVWRTMSANQRKGNVL